MLEALITHHYLIMLVLTFGGMLCILLVEQIMPRRAMAVASPGRRWLTNWMVAYINYVALVWVSTALATSTWLRAWVPDFTLLTTVHPVLAFVVAYGVLEIIAYVMHRLHHSVPWLWRLHAVHHSDTHMDVTTAHRHHLFEPLINLVLLIPVLMLLGTPAAVMVLVVMVREALVLFNHSNLSIPPALDRILRWVIVTPDFHRLHHRSDQQYTDSNYGVTLTVFDHLFRSATDSPHQEQAQFELGLEYLRTPKDSRLDRLFLLPFKWQAWGQPSRRKKSQ
jgi:sterol desaturase/sphingolipid hydroxylase (fatty acid hydroxylase superfamily)